MITKDNKDDKGSKNNKEDKDNKVFNDNISKDKFVNYMIESKC